MNRAGVSRRTLLSATLIGMTVALAGCKVVSIAEQKKEADSGAFDAKAWADQLWAPRVLPYFSANAKPMPDVLRAISADFDQAGKTLGYRPASEGSPWTFVVSGAGSVLEKNTESRAGTLSVALDGADPDQPVTLQIGPVIIGSAIRDSLPFVNFKDFTNQIEFADAGKALTALALLAISRDLPTIKVGSRIKFTGAFSLTGKSDTIKVTPAALMVTP